MPTFLTAKIFFSLINARLLARFPLQIEGEGAEKISTGRKFG